jgi:hypothetical protein
MGWQCPGVLPGSAPSGSACAEATPPMRSLCERAPEVIPIGKRPNSYGRPKFAKVSNENSIRTTDILN